jgi:hypothetical protein
LANARESQKKKAKNKTAENKTGLKKEYSTQQKHPFDFDLKSTLASHLDGGVIMSFL